MTAALHAQRILEAWDRFDPASFEAELENALSACRQSSLSSEVEVEVEQKQVLESVVCQLQRLPVEEGTITGHQFQAGFLLLRHLQTRSEP